MPNHANSLVKIIVVNLVVDILTGENRLGEESQNGEEVLVCVQTLECDSCWVSHLDVVDIDRVVQRLDKNQGIIRVQCIDHLAEIEIEVLRSQSNLLLFPWTLRLWRVVHLLGVRVDILLFQGLRTLQEARSVGPKSVLVHIFVDFVHSVVVIHVLEELPRIIEFLNLLLAELSFDLRDVPFHDAEPIKGAGWREEAVLADIAVVVVAPRFVVPVFVSWIVGIVGIAEHV